MSTLLWTRSSYCDSAGINCVEVAKHPAGVAVVRIRDSAVHHGTEVSCGPAAWTKFLVWAAGPDEMGCGVP
ncbi:DUF397 domain-containing protein [Streptomyces lonegramiae]|uniref:DUF397 domain-containing protein n=1 Tax=Streptomyces lonegramiae TaxID=3075524 RepID=A0ABU2XP48_9ACTN|nr:DUF397 domain-containing protein [Streptomyces sp. DSM 41529]MDT0547701.1 DUF397 domain-containing protein [Streptomyces sp. DSM 41529]